jgi:hypothetical protein
MSEQDNSTRLDENEGSGLLRSVEPTGGRSYSMSASDTVDGGTDAGKDADGTDKSGDSDGTDGGGDSDGTDASGDADGTDSGADSDASDATADADGTDN